MKEWSTRPLAEVCNVEFGTRVVRKRDGGSGYPVYGGGGATFQVSAFNREDRLVIARFGMSELCTRFVVGRFFLNDSGLTVSPRSAALLQRFLDYHMLAMNDSIYALGKGAAQKNLDVTDFRNLPVSAPKNIDEQQRIVSVLDKGLAAIAKARTNTERNVHNAHELFESSLNSTLAHRGDAWLEKPLGDLCEIKHGFAFAGEFFSDEGAYLLLSPGNFYEKGGFRDRGAKQRHFTGEIPRDFVLEQGDLLVAMTEQAAGLLGSPILIPEADKYLHNQRLGLVTAKPGVPWSNEFFFHVFNTRAVRKAIHDGASGVKVRHTSPSKIGQIRVLYPRSLTEQRTIASNLTNLSNESERFVALAKKKLTALAGLQRSLLRRAFAGGL